MHRVLLRPVRTEVRLRRCANWPDGRCRDQDARLGETCVPTTFSRSVAPSTGRSAKSSRGMHSKGPSSYRAWLCPSLTVSAQIVHCHHAHIDRRGSSLWLTGGQILLSGRLVAVIDVFDTQVMDRADRRAIRRTGALKPTRAGRGARFDTDMVESIRASR